MHDNIRVHSHAVERAKLLKAICQRKCFRPIFPNIFDIVANYCAEKNGMPLVPVTCKKDNGDYFDFESDPQLIFNLRKAIIDNTKRNIQKSGMPRAERRTYQRKIISPNGYLTKYGVEKYQEDLASNTFSHNNKSNLINLTDFMSEETFLKMLSGNITDQQATDDLLSRMMDIEFLIERFSSKEPELQEIFRSYIQGEGIGLIKAHEKILTTISIELEKVESHEMNQALKKAATNATKDSFKQTLTNIYYKNEQKAKARKITKSMWDECIRHLDYTDIPVLGIFFCLNRDLLIKRIDNKGSATKQGDMADVLHACYAPYCDIMHVDKRTFALLENIREEANIATVFVKRIRELPEKIESILMQPATLQSCGSTCVEP